MARYNYTIGHVPGKLLYAADALFRSPLPETDPADDLQCVADTCIASIVGNLPTDRIDWYPQAQAKDVVLQKVMLYCRSKWPDRSEIISFWRVQSSLTVFNDTLL